MRSLSSARVSGLLLLGAVGCGLISSDITKVTFDLPAKTYAFDTSTLGLPAGSSTAVPCGGTSPVQDCCNPPAPLPAVDCTMTPLVCQAGVCTLEQPFTTHQMMDLKTEAPELSSLSGQHLANVTLESLHYAAHSTLNVDVPPFDLYLAPQTVTDPKNAMAQKFGTVPTIKAGTSPSGDIVKAPGADALFTQYATNFATPFNFIGSTTIVVPSGSATPTGALTITVTGTVSAKPSL